MTFSNLVLALRRVTGRRASRRTVRLMPVRPFRRVLARERARSDRTGDRFCLLVFSPSEPATADELHHLLAELLRRRLRLTDEAGWVDERRIGVVLPATSPRGAWKLSEDISHAL